MPNETNSIPSCSLCGLPPLGESLIAGEGELAGQRYCCSGCAAVDDILHRLPEKERAAAMLEIAARVGLPTAQVAALAVEAHEEGDNGADTPEGERRSGSVVEERFRVGGMQCPSCSWLVEHTLFAAPGVLDAKVDFLTEIGTLRLDLRKTSREKALSSLESVGYRAQRLDDEAAGDPERLVLRCAISAMAAMNTMMLAFVHYAETFGATAGAWRMTVGAFGATLAIPAVIYGGAPIFRRAFASLTHRHVTMETLLTLGITASLGFSLLAFVLPEAGFYFEIPTMIVTTALGARLVDRAIRRAATRRVAALLEPRPLRVRLAAQDSPEVVGFVSLAELTVNQRILVPPGEEVPSDVEVIGDDVAVSEAVLTGEPRPIRKRLGATVLAGSVVIDHGSERALLGRVLRPPSASAHAQIGEQILEIVRGQSEATALADRIAARFVIIVLALAALTIIGHFVYSEARLLDSTVWLPAVAVLVVACPCAFSIAASASRGTAAIRMLSDGILVRRPEAMEEAASASVVVFDKTGTLTQGDMDVLAIDWRGGQEAHSEEMLGIVAALERCSRHPMAVALRRHLQTLSVRATEKLVEIEEISGLGVRGRDSSGKSYAIGVPELFEDGHETDWFDSEDSRSAVLFGSTERVSGRFVFDDPLRAEARGVVARLRELDVEVQLLSGDEMSVVERCAQELGIATYEGRALPLTKAQKVEALRAKGRHVMYVGDGINDAPALAAASVGIAMRHGASVALETSDMLAVRDDPLAAVQAIEVARRLRRITLQNYAWAIGYNALLLPVAAIGWLHPTYSAVAMLLSSVTVLANSARLLRENRSLLLSTNLSISAKIIST